MKSKMLFLLGFTAMLAFTACNKGGKTGLLIPHDAGLVVHLDLSSLSSKLTWKEIQQTAWYAEAQKQTNDSLAKKLLANPAASGIDTEGSLVMFMKRTSNNGYMAFEGKIKNAEQFKTTIQQAGEGKAKLVKEGDLTVATIDGNDKAVLYFNDKLFVFIADASDAKKVIPETGVPSSQNYSLDSLKHFAKSTFSLKGKNLLDSDDRFTSLIKEKADMHYWVNSSTLYGGLLSGMMSMMKIGDLLADNISMGTANFENGKIVANATQLYGKKLTELFTKYNGKEVSSDLLSRLPDGDVLAAFAMNYNPEGIKEFLKLLGIDGMVNAGLGQLGVNFTIDDFIKANAGELGAALTGLSITPKPSSVTLNDGEVIAYDDQKTDLQFVLGVSVNDTPSFQKLIDAITTLKSSGAISLKADSANEKIKNKLQDKWFALGSSDTEVNTFLSGNKRPAYANLFSGHNGGGFIDLQKVITAVAANNKDTADKEAFKISAAFWKNATMYWDVKGGKSTSHFEITLADGNTNALKQLNKYIDAMFVATEKKRTEDFGLIETPEPADSIVY